MRQTHSVLGNSAWSAPVKVPRGLFPPMFQWLLESGPVAKGVTQTFDLSTLVTGAATFKVTSSDPGAVAATLANRKLQLACAWNGTSDVARITLRLKSTLRPYTIAYTATLTRATGSVAIVGTKPAGRADTFWVTLENRTGQTVHGLLLKRDPRRGDGVPAVYQEWPCLMLPGDTVDVKGRTGAGIPQDRGMVLKAWPILSPLAGKPALIRESPALVSTKTGSSRLLEAPAILNRQYGIQASDDGGITWTLRPPNIRASSAFLMWLDADEAAPSNRIYRVMDEGL